MLKRSSPFFLTIVFVLSCGVWTSTIARDGWVSVRSKHLLVIGNGPEKDIRLVAARLEQFREVVSQIFANSKPDSPVPTTVIVFKDDASYRPFKTSENNAGYFQPGQDVNYITLSGEARGDRDHFSIIFHEYTHLIVNNTLGNAPAWFNEGLAELYSTVNITKDQTVTLGRPIRRHITSLHQNPQLPLRQLFQVDYKSPYYNESIFYAQSWALMHYLVLNKNGERVGQVINFLESLRSHTPLEQAFQKAFGTSFENMEGELRGYIQQDRYRFAESSFTARFKNEAQTIVRALSEAEAQAYLGDLLLHSKRAEAEVYLQRALALDSDNPLANASLGILRFREGRFAEALQLLERAIAAGSNNALVHYYYASALCRPKQEDLNATLGYSQETALKARSELKKAIALRQDFAEPYNLLAYVNLVTSTDIDETIELLKAALGRSPDKIDFIYMLGQLYLHKDNYKHARSLLNRVVAGDVDPEVRQHAEKLLLTITSIESQQAETETARRARGLSSNSLPAATENVANQIATDPSLELREALRIPAAGETRIQGMLLSIECEPTGLVFVVKTGDRILRLRTDSFQQIKRTTFTSDVTGTITCGARKPENAVVICYFPGNDKLSRAEGVLRSVEFVPADFRLSP